MNDLAIKPESAAGGVFAREFADPASRFANLSRPAAVWTLALLAALITLGLFFPARTLPADVAGPSINTPLYSGILARVRAGESYESAAVTAQRSGGFPLRPFVTVRPPALALLLARLPDVRTADLAMRWLALAVLVAWTYRLRSAAPGLFWMAWLPLAAFSGVAWAIPSLGLSLFHECWAGLLIALSLAARTERRFAISVVLGLAAALIRELALPYLLVMALLALLERRRGEALAFALALAISLAALALHASAVIALTNSHDLASSGWVKLGGWPFVMATNQWNLFSVLLGPAAAAVVLPLALCGAAGRRDGVGLRLAALLAGYTLGFLVIGRPHDTGWGFIDAPLIGVGLALAPLAVVDLVRRATGIRPQGLGARP